MELFRQYAALTQPIALFLTTLEWTCHRSSRAQVLAAKEVEADRCQLVQADVLFLQQELDRETERLAASLRERRDEEEEHFLSEVGSTGTVSSDIGQADVMVSQPD